MLLNKPPKFLRYNELTEDDIGIDYQIHTNQTDGEGTIDEVIAIAQTRGLSAIAFTDHVRRDTEWFPAYVKQLRKAALVTAELKIYIGCEAKALDHEGSLDVPKKIIKECGLVLGSVHRFPNGSARFMNWNELDDEAFAKVEFSLALGLLKAAPIHVLAHPGGMYQRRRRRPFPESLLRLLMMASLERKIAFEINSSYMIDIDSFLRLCKEVNPYISIGSDAHKLDEVANCRDMLLGTKILS